MYLYLAPSVVIQKLEKSMVYRQMDGVIIQFTFYHYSRI